MDTPLPPLLYCPHHEHQDGEAVGPNSKSEGPDQPESTEPRVKLDQVLKALFSVSVPVMITMLNSLFHEDYPPGETELTVTSNEFILDEYDLIRGDLFFKLQALPAGPRHYHIDFQTTYDQAMVIRMFDYGMAKARENARNEEQGSTGELVLTIPRQLVILIEPHRAVTDTLRVRLIFPNGQEMIHPIGVLKYWEYDTPGLLRERLYPLLPLQVFTLRRTLQRLSRRQDPGPDLLQAIREAKARAQAVAEAGRSLYDQRLITGEDLETILTAVDYLFKYLNNRYSHIKTLNQEVETMLRTLYDPAVEERGRQKGRDEGLKEGQRDILRRQITKKFGQPAPELSRRIDELGSEGLDELAEQLLDFQTLADLTQWLEKRS